MPGIRAKLGAIATIACVSILAACGGGDDSEGTIPREQGQALLTQLDTIREAVEAGDCTTAEAEAVGLSGNIENLPESVDSELRSALLRTSDNLTQQTRTQCEEPEPEPEVPTGPSGETGALPEPPTEDPATETSEPPPTEPAEPGGPAARSNPGQGPDAKPEKPNKPDKPNNPGGGPSGGISSN